MLKRIKSAPPILLVLFSLVLSLEVYTFVATLQIGALMRFILLTVLMFLALGGLRIARNSLIFLLFAGAIFLTNSGVISAHPFLLTLFFQFGPAILLLSTALYLLFSKEFKNFLSTKPNTENELQSL